MEVDLERLGDAAVPVAEEEDLVETDDERVLVNLVLICSEAVEEKDPDVVGAVDVGRHHSAWVGTAKVFPCVGRRADFVDAGP